MLRRIWNEVITKAVLSWIKKISWKDILKKKLNFLFWKVKSILSRIQFFIHQKIQLSSSLGVNFSNCVNWKTETCEIIERQLTFSVEDTFPHFFEIWFFCIMELTSIRFGWFFVWISFSTRGQGMIWFRSDNFCFQGSRTSTSRPFGLVRHCKKG